MDRLVAAQAIPRWARARGRRQRRRLLPAPRKRDGHRPGDLPGRRQLNLDWLLESLAQRGDADAVIDGSQAYSYRRAARRDRAMVDDLCRPRPGRTGRQHRGRVRARGGGRDHRRRHRRQHRGAALDGRRCAPRHVPGDGGRRVSRDAVRWRPAGAWRRGGRPRIRSTRRCARRPRRVSCCSRRARPGRRRPRCTTSACCCRSSRCRAMPFARWSSCSSITSAA